jgi:2-amino-4-hydroxy-6-hydroxymethyldihydropteridine diphosphokinase
MQFWLGLGSNLGDRVAALQAGIDTLAAAGIVADAVSGVYETAPQDMADQPAFLNAVIRARTDLGPPAVLAVAKRVEHEAGRTAGPRYGPRPLDVDLLAWEGGEWQSSDPDLVIPHPRICDRRFVLVPLVEVEPRMELPDGSRISALLDALDAPSQPVHSTPLALALPGSAPPGL